MARVLRTCIVSRQCWFYTNSDGANPYAGLILSGNTLYGTALYGGSSGDGTVFAINTDGTGFTNLHSFTATLRFGLRTNSDGAYPSAGLILSGNTLYGTTSDGGSSGNGTVFAVNTDGTGFTILHSFADYPQRRSLSVCRIDFIRQHPVWDDAGWRQFGQGHVFAVNTNGTGFTSAIVRGNLWCFLHQQRRSLRLPLDFIGQHPVWDGAVGGSSGSGTVFSLSLPPPQLTISPSGANVILTWPTIMRVQLRRVHFAIHHQPCFTCVLDHRFSGADRRQRAERRDQPISGTQQFYRLLQ